MLVYCSASSIKSLKESEQIQRRTEIIPGSRSIVTQGFRVLALANLYLYIEKIQQWEAAKFELTVMLSKLSRLPLISSPR